MKTILSLFLLPILVFAQPNSKHYEEPIDIEFSIDFDLESIFNEQITSAELVDGAVELFITVELVFWENGDDLPKISHGKETVYSLPKNLNTFTLVGWPDSEREPQKTEERLNSLLAQNDSMFPKEDTLFDWLRPVKYQQNRLGAVENVMEGFGPRISL